MVTLLPNPYIFSMWDEKHSKDGENKNNDYGGVSMMKRMTVQGSNSLNKMKMQNNYVKLPKEFGRHAPNWNKIAVII